MNAIVTLPRVTIEVDGTPLKTSEAQALSELHVRQALSMPTLCELAFQQPDGELAEGSRLLPGARLRVTVEGEPETLFNGEITALEYAYGPASQRQVRVRGYDLLHRLRKRQPVRSHVEMTVEELAQELIGDLGLSVKATDSGPLSRRLVQWRESDLELLVEAARGCGLYLFAHDDLLHIMSLAGTGEPVELALGKSLREARVDVNTDPACRTVQAWGWNPWRVETHRGEASDPRVGRRVGVEATPEQVGAPGERILVDRTFQSDEEAGALAQGELDRRVAGEVVLRGVADGDSRLRPGVPVDLDGVATPLTGRYVLASVRHYIDRVQGFRSEFDTAPPTAQPRPQAAGSTVGVVTDVDDPDQLGRVRVALTNYGELETDWLQVLSPGAGKDKGLVALPDVDDQVLVSLTAGAPAQGIVLGGLYGAEGPPDAGVEDGGIRRYTLVTPRGQQLQLDDKKRRARLQNDGGNYVQLTPGRARLSNSSGSFIELTRDRVRLHAKAALEIEAPGQSVTIRGASIDFERA